MPASRTVTRNGRTITFTEDEHIYLDDLGNPYTSVTTLVGKFFPPFDADAIAARMESEGKGEKDALKAVWASKRDAAAEFGTRVHETAEAALRGLSVPHKPRDEKERAAFSAVWRYSRETLLASMRLVGAEILVFSPRYLIAGTIDLAMKTPTGGLWLLDWKTNEKIDTEGFNGSRALWPIEHMPDCNASKYGLQLNVYERILRDQGYIKPDVPVKRGLLWVHDGGKVDLIPIPELPFEVANIMLAHATEVPF